MKDEGARDTFNSWKYCRYFEFVSVQDAKNVVVVCCELCVRSKILSAVINTTSYFLIKYVERPFTDNDTLWLKQKLDFRAGHSGRETLSAVVERKSTSLGVAFKLDSIHHTHSSQRMPFCLVCSHHFLWVLCQNEDESTVKLTT